MANKKGMNPLAAGAIGAAIGAAVGVAAVELSDEKNRQAVGKKLGELRIEGEKVYTQIQKSANEAKDRIESAKNSTEKNIKKLSAHKSKK